jgi:hypothetical protein
MLSSSGQFLHSFLTPLFSGYPLPQRPGGSYSTAQSNRTSKFLVLSTAASWFEQLGELVRLDITLAPLCWSNSGSDNNRKAGPVVPRIQHFLKIRQFRHGQVSVIDWI